MVNIIHLRNTDYSDDRYNSFMKELNEQGITDYKIWDGIHDTNKIRAISRAHKQIVSYAKENGLPEVCIMEDDCIFLGLGAFEYFNKSKPFEYSLFLGGISNRIKVEGNCILDFRGLTLYYIHQSFYEVFLSVPENKNIDEAMKGLGKYYLCPKVVCSQRAGYSYHKKMNKDYSHLLKQYPLYEKV